MQPGELYETTIEYIEKAMAEANDWTKTDELWILQLQPDYNEKVLDNRTLAEILKSDCPEDKFDSILREWSLSVTDYYINDLHEYLKSKTGLEDDVIRQFTDEYCCVEYGPDGFDTKYHTILTLDTGDADAAFASNNCLNYHSGWRKTLKEPSAVLWLAEKLRKKDRLLEELEKYTAGTEREKTDDTFIESVIQELKNNSCCCSALTFLTEMSLQEIFEFKKKIKSEKSKIDSQPDEFTVSKDTMCGLFDSWAGGGSVLEIELPDDVKIPYKYVHRIWFDGTKLDGMYDVDETYGLTEKCWHGKITM